MARLWAAKVSYDSVQVGDELPILVIHESQETMVNYARYAPQNPGPDRPSLNAGEKRGKKAVPGGSVDMGTATVAHVAALLEKAFPLKNLMAYGSRLEMRATKPVGPGDTLTFTGRVTAKREEGAYRLVDCEVIGSNQLNKVVARAKATIAFSA